MKLFLKRFILFVIPFIVIAYPVDLLLSHLIKDIKQYPGEFEVMKDIYNGTIESDIAIYGSSRAWIQISPEIIQDTLGKTVYNLGLDGHHFWLQYLRHLEYLRHNRKPEIIIISLDAFSLEIRNDLYAKEQYLPYMLWNKNIIRYTSRYEGYHWLDYYIPFFRYVGEREVIRQVFANIFSRNPGKKIRTRGYAGMNKVWNSDFDNAKSKLKVNRIKLKEQSVQLFYQFIDECKNMNIKLVFVCTPEYIEGQQRIHNRAEIISMYRDIAKKNGLVFIDYSNDAICLDKSMFYNSLHLNKTGSELMTKKLAGQLKSLLKKQETHFIK